MNFLIFGCNGMAGHLISLYLKEQGHQVTGFARKQSNLVNSIVGDAKDVLFVKEIVGTGKFDTIINCIGVLNQFAENDKASAVFINSFFPHYLAQITDGTSTQVIQISTDCVFSGSRGQYTESDIRDGASFYDRSKALGELEDQKNLTLRQSIVGPDPNPNGIGLMNWFLQQKGSIYGYTDAIWTGQTTLQLAKTIEKAAQEHAHGLYNMVPEHSISKYELLKLFNNHFCNNEKTILPTAKVHIDKSLKRTRWEFDYTIPEYDIMIQELADWLYQHKGLYPHYYG